jgi:DNA-directed RNA polymerase subunit RPC12/RpoP
MLATISCPVCGCKQSISEGQMKQLVTCPRCAAAFHAGASVPLAQPVEAVGQAATGPSEVEGPAARVAPAVRPAGAQPEEVIHYNCPRCKKSLESPARMAGQKLNCPDCAQRIQVPQPPVATAPVLTPAVGPVAHAPGEEIHYHCPRCKKSLESPARMAGQKLNCPDCGQRLQVPQPAAPPLPPCPSSEAPAAPPPRVVVHQATPKHQHCLECGGDVTGRERLVTCPDCGSAFCSAICYRNHRAYAHGPRRR